MYRSSALPRDEPVSTPTWNGTSNVSLTHCTNLYFCGFTEEQEKPADLSQRVVFKKPKKALVEEGEEVEAADLKDPKLSSVKKGRKKESSSAKASSSSAGKLSFAQDEEEEEGDF